MYDIIYNTALKLTFCISNIANNFNTKQHLYSNKPPAQTSCVWTKRIYHASQILNIKICWAQNTASDAWWHTNKTNSTHARNYITFCKYKRLKEDFHFRYGLQLDGCMDVMIKQSKVNKGGTNNSVIDSQIFNINNLSFHRDTSTHRARTGCKHTFPTQNT
jgi:hypothetical protein